jgi:hypothetical protein
MTNLEEKIHAIIGKIWIRKPIDVEFKAKSKLLWTQKSEKKVILSYRNAYDENWLICFIEKFDYRQKQKKVFQMRN